MRFRGSSGSEFERRQGGQASKMVNRCAPNGRVLSACSRVFVCCEKEKWNFVSSDRSPPNGGGVLAIAKRKVSRKSVDTKKQSSNKSEDWPSGSEHQAMVSLGTSMEVSILHDRLKFDFRKIFLSLH